MSDLRLENWRLPAAPLGSENPLPRFDAPSHQPVLSGKPEGEAEAGYLPDYLPYPVQDGYSRQRQLTDLKVAVLENDILRATFLLEYGGRLSSLVHKPSGRELLFVNPIFQPGNLAVRNAWFSGGVEWNMGVIGHTPFTCSPLFTARVERTDGTPILRLYEWERIRQVAQETDDQAPAARPDLAQFDQFGQGDTRPFTPRERQILRGVFSGKSNKEIAHDMNISESLVKAVLQQLFAKTGVRTRSQLVRTAIERHWKELEEETEGS